MAGNTSPRVVCLDRNRPTTTAATAPGPALKALAVEAGWRHLALPSGLSTLNSLLDIAGLGLAQARLSEKPFKKIDEPTAFLDAKAAERVRLMMHERAQQRLMLISTHDKGLSAQADQVITMDPHPASPPATVPRQTS